MGREAGKHRVTVFSPFDFEPGQKIHIEKGPRKGDWEVIGVTERTVRLKCPVSLREFEWNRFCYHAGERTVDTWPGED
ncbi:MAG: hypothetical protein LJE94_09045 [Deltaproteobacteria bacterium]|jgi:hypothetical protein|nr:hypothetical protein [Deltaproteobacteria bacterium]